MRFSTRAIWRPAAADALLVALTWLLAFLFRFSLLRNDAPVNLAQILWISTPLAAVVWVAALAGLGVYRTPWRHTSVPEFKRLASAMIVAALALAAVLLLLRLPNFPRSIVLLHPLFAGAALLGLRLGARILAEGRLTRSTAQGKPLLVLGTLDEAARALQSLRSSKGWQVAALISPNRGEVGRSVQGVRVAGSVDDLARVAQAQGASHALIASEPGSPARRELLLQASDAHLALLTLPRADDWLQSGSSAGGGQAPRQVELADLLGRPAVQLDVRGLSSLLAGQVALVTGAGGSIGSELCRQIARFGVRQLVCIDSSEIAIYALEQEFKARFPELAVRYYTANVREPERLLDLFKRHRPAVVLHAAAYKHVPLMEDDNAIEALRTNVLGTLGAARAATASGAQRFVLISTDKAVNPTNVMGASKRLAELALQAHAAQHPDTHCCAVRFGNVLGSSGSVVPRFAAQIAAGGPVTVTHPEIVRYFMTIPEAAQLVLQAGLMGESGNIFVLDMGEPVKIVDLARLMIRLSNKTEEEIPIHFTGLRPGEKLFEELLADDETTLPTPHPKLRVARQAEQDAIDLQALELWIAASGADSPAQIKAALHALVPEYTPQ
ncbi:MAG: polysaccharide biosynthesis protein [Thiomonas sp.]|uniref:polysaccharide biosynthesis protein n=1 Tax=Thiomonas TaxID=32012 RepID=UPI0023A700D3|nr:MULTISPECIES: nucleoside-diphosphate sugar epimerase/dehydratase [Thiomonas]MDE2269957.1 polysaccharide biosynthesis protein [Betaproteobacteria bacterium]HML82084.1 nucleoside-diphosphate sugar epimerase/dehydratase [Thiomonas arsenitoxydans]